MILFYQGVYILYILYLILYMGEQYHQVGFMGIDWSKFDFFIPGVNKDKLTLRNDSNNKEQSYYFD